MVGPPPAVNSLRPSDAYMCRKLTIIGSDNGLSLGQCQAIIWTNAGILLIRPLGTNYSEILIAIETFSLNSLWLVMSYGSRSWSTLTQVMAFFLMASGHYLNQCWLLISNLGRVAFIWGHNHEKIWRYQLIKQAKILQIVSRSPRDQWVKSGHWWLHGNAWLVTSCFMNITKMILPQNYTKYIFMLLSTLLVLKPERTFPSKPWL